MASGTHPHSREPAALLLNGHGTIEDCTPHTERLFGYQRSHLTTRPATLLIPGLAAYRLLIQGEPNPHLRMLSRIGAQFEAIKSDGGRFWCYLALSFVGSEQTHLLRLTVTPVDSTSTFDSHSIHLEPHR